MTKGGGASGSTFVTRLTADAPSAISVLRIWGTNAVEIADKFFQPKRGKTSLANTPPGQLRLGWFGRDEVVALIDVDAHTRQPEVEIQGHGSTVLVDSLLKLLSSAGVLVTEHDDYLSQHGVGWLERLARTHLGRCTSPRAAEILWYQASGQLRKEIHQIRESLVHSNLMGALKQLDALLASSTWAMRLSSGFKVALSGAPNVGKSTLVNSIAGYQRVIVSPVAGTTRDIVDVALNIAGWPVILTDMAGIREMTNDQIEAAGIRLAIDETNRADLVLLMQEASACAHSFPRPPGNNPRFLKVYTKSDLVDDDPRLLRDVEAIYISAITGQGTAELMAEMINRLVPLGVRQSDGSPCAVVFDVQIRDGLGEVKKMIASEKISEAIDKLDLILTP